MNKQSAVQQVVILADDFTGANDAGVSLAQAGMRGSGTGSDISKRCAGAHL
jgi:hypothetical protein